MYLQITIERLISLNSYSLYIEKIKNIPQVLQVIISSFLLYFFYSIGYLFLYGFYFANFSFDSNIPSFSFDPLFEVIRNPVPFNFYTVITTSVFFLALVIWIISSITMIRKNIFFVIPVAIISLAVHIAISIIFIGRLGQDFEFLLFSLLLWGAPLVIAYTIYIISEFMKNPITAMSAFLWMFIILMIYAVKASTISNDIHATFLGILTLFFAFVSIPLLNFIDSLDEKQISWTFLRVGATVLQRLLIDVPYITFISLLAFVLLEHIQPNFCTLLIIFTVLFYISRHLYINCRNKRKASHNNQNQDTQINSRPLIKQDKVLALSFLGLLFFIVFTLTIVTAVTVVITGEVIHHSLPKDNQLTSDKETVIIKSPIEPYSNYSGKVVAYKDNVLYIVTSERKLVITKANEFIIITD